MRSRRGASVLGGRAGLLMSLPAAAVLAAAPALAQPGGRIADEARAYYAGNGFLGRGLNELAEAEYRAFLRDHAGHEKAAAARYGLAVSLVRQGRHDEAEAEARRVAGVPGFAFAAEAGVIVGQCRAAAGDHAGAARAFSDLVDAHPRHDLADDAASLAAEHLYRAGDHASAVAMAASVAERWPQSPQRPRATYFRGLALSALGRDAEAAEQFADAARTAPDTDFGRQAGLLAAQSLQRSGATADAASGFERIIRGGDGPGVPEAMVGLAAIRLDEGRAGDAAGLLDRFMGRYADHEAVPRARLLRAHAWFDQGEFDRALPLFEESAETSPDAAYWAAKCMLRLDRHEHAAAALGEFLRRPGSDRLAAEATYDRAVALSRAGEAGEALGVLDGFAARFPGHELAGSAARLEAGLAYGAGEFDRSLSMARAAAGAAATDADRAEADFLVAESLLLLGRDEQAAAAYRAFLSDHATDDRADRAAYRLGTLAYAAGDADASREHLSRVARGDRTEEAFRPALLLLGDLALRDRDWGPAEALLGDFLGFGLDQPQADEAMLKLGVARIEQGRPAEALAVLTDLVDRFPRSGQRTAARFEQGRALAASGDRDGAFRLFDRVAADDPDGRYAAYALAQLGSISQARGDAAAAAEFFDRAARAGGDAGMAATARFHRACSLADAGDHDRAADAFERFASEFDGDDRAAEAMARRAVSLSRANRPAEAVAAIDAGPGRGSWAGLPPSLRGALAYERAWSLAVLGRTDEAAHAYRDLLADPPSEALRAHASVELAAILAKGGDDAGAAALLEAALGPDGSASDVPAELRARSLYQLGSSDYRLGRHGPALDRMEAFIAAAGDDPAGDPLVASASLVAGECALALGRHTRAADHFRRVVDRFPDDPARPTALLRLGDCLAALQRWQDAAKAFAEHRRAYADSELWFQASFGVAWARENQRRFDEAIAEYRGIIDRHEGETAARAQFQVGECLFALGRHDEAAKELLKVDILYAYPRWSAAALFEAGRCFEALNQPGRARDQYEAISARYADSPWAAMAAERLAAIRTEAPPGR